MVALRQKGRFGQRGFFGELSEAEIGQEEAFCVLSEAKIGQRSRFLILSEEAPMDHKYGLLKMNALFETFFLLFWGIFLNSGWWSTFVAATKRRFLLC